jgi:hydrogenase small subunit
MPVPDKNGVLARELEARGVSRRDFMKFCGVLATMIGLEASAAPQIAAALESSKRLKPVVWLEGGSCSGCTESTAQSEDPDIAAIVLDIISLNYSETLMAAAGYAAEQAKDDTIAAGNYVLVYEGSVMTGWDGTALMVAGKKGTEDLITAAKSAEAIIAVGSCAVDGGWVAAAPNPAKATGVGPFLASQGISKPLINLPTCPVNPVWVVSVLVEYLILGKVPDLDAEGRPKAIFGQTIHDNCPRRGHFENGEFVYQFGSAEEAKGYCLYPMGCKGPQTKTNCPIVRWNNAVSWCVQSGAPCIGCGNYQWVDKDAPFLRRMPELPVGTGVQPMVFGLGAAGVVAAGLAVHGIGMKAAGRTGRVGVPTEDMKEYDRKHAKKGGDQ